MSAYRIGCLVGTRPECIKMAPVIQALRKSAWADVVVISTGQHREMLRQTLETFGLCADIDLDVMVAGQTLASLSSLIFAKIDEVFQSKHFDLLLVQGDTTSVMVASLAAFYRHIPVAHVEAGLRTHDLQRPFPEELNRVVTGRVARLHFAPTERAQRNLLAEGVAADAITVTGNTVIDALQDVASRDLPCAFPKASENMLVLITAHRRENFGAPLKSICEAVVTLHDSYPDLEFVYPVHPNPNIKGPVYDYLGGLERVNLIPPADYVDLVSLMKRARFIITDSGGIQEEAPALCKPVLVLREETERPEAVEAGVAHIVGTDKDRIVSEARRLIEDPEFFARMASGASPYGDGLAAGRIAHACRAFLEARGLRKDLAAVGEKI